MTHTISREIDCTKKYCTSHTGGKIKTCQFYDNWQLNGDGFDCMAYEVKLKRKPRPERCPACKLSERKVKR